MPCELFYDTSHLLKHPLRVGKFIEIQENSFSYQRNQSKIDAEAVLDGLYIIISTSLDEETLSATDTVKADKNISQVEQAFRCYKTVDLKVRLIYHYTAERVKAHIYVCCLIM